MRDALFNSLKLRWTVYVRFVN